MRLFPAQPGDVVEIPALGASPRNVHVLEDDQIIAVNAALASRRALLVRGEPGVGKSQLAIAAARALGRVLVPVVIDASTEPRELLWTFDAVARLAEAQLVGALGRSDPEWVRDQLAPRRFVIPGPVWWAFDWSSAEAQARLSSVVPPPQLDEADPLAGAVLLIDEIDKADASVPNALLEALGSGRFHPPGHEHPIMMREPRPLVVITTNEERALPDAFVRRCIVLHLELPSEGELVPWLVARGAAHFNGTSEKVLQRAAEILAKDRSIVAHRGLCPPGQAEYLDLVRAVIELAPGEADQLVLVEKISQFVLRKQPMDSPR